MKRSVFALLAAATLVSACASKSEDIAPSYVSPAMYQSFSCKQLGDEALRVASRVSQVSGQQDVKASNDAGKMAVGLVLFWPALIFMDGDDATTAELARLKGEMDAIEEANTAKNCGIRFQE